MTIEKPAMEFAFEIRVDVTGGKMMEMGHTPKGLRKIVPILGGEFDGPDIKGKILPGGYDWQLMRADAVTEIEARYVLQTDDGSLITIVNSGFRHGPADIMARMANGEEVNPSEYYFRSIPVFESSDIKYNWLNKFMFIANGIRKPEQVLIQVWKVL